MSPRFSAVVVARNEEALIRRCLESVAWCDERILIDMDSSDDTRELATPLATKIIPQEWIPHMEWARNRGIELATGDWILVVDADEVITATLAERLRAQVASAGGTAGIWIPRMSCWFGRRLPHIGGFPDHQLRCFRRGAGLYPDRLHSHPEIDGRTIFLPIEEDAWSPLAVLWAAASAFRFFVAKGYRDGVAGLVLSVLFDFYRFETEAKRWEGARYPREGDATVQRLGSLPRLAAALTGHGCRRLWARRRSVR